MTEQIHSLSDEGQASAELSIGVCAAGGAVAEACINDPAFIAKWNWPGELAARVYRAMASESAHEASLATGQGQST